MSRVLTLLITLCAGGALAQAPDRSADLNRAYYEAIEAQRALQAMEARREQAAEPEAGERTGNIGGGSRLNENYFARQEILDKEVAAARQRYEAALKRWNDLK